MKTAIKLASIGLITTSIAQSAQDPRFLSGNANPNNGLGQSILLDPTIGDKILEDDIATALAISLQEYETNMITKAQAESKNEEKKNDLDDISKIFNNIALIESIEAEENKNKIEKNKKQIEADELFARQIQSSGNLDQSYYGDEFIKAIELSLQSNFPEAPVEVKAPEIPDIKIEGIIGEAGKFLAKLHNDLIKTDYPDYYELLKELEEATQTLDQMESMDDVNHMDIITKQRQIEILKNKVNEEEKIISAELRANYDALDKVRALMRKFNINEKNAKEILIALDL